MTQLSAMDLNLLVALDVLLDTSSVSQAAKRIGVTTSAMSHTLGRLREQLGDPLFVRAGRGLVPTPRAQSLRVPVKEAVVAVSAVFQPPDVIDPLILQRRFRMQLTDQIALQMGPCIDGVVSRQAPGVDLVMAPLVPDVTPPLRGGEIDLAIGVWSELPPDIQRVLLYSEGFVCVVRADHPDIGEALDLQQYVAMSHILVSPRGRPGGYVDQVLAERGLKRRVARVVPYFVPAVQLVAGSNRVLTVSEGVARTLADVWPIRLLKPPLPLRRYALEMVWHRRTEADPEHLWFRAAVRAATEDLPATPRQQ